MAIKDHYQSVSWSEWPEALRLRQREALARCRSDYQEDIRYYCFLQYEFSRQWAQLKAYVNRQGIQIIGDIPIYVAFDSADSWSHPELFQFDADRRPVQVAGCPPDAFAADGQLWGNPLYSWDYHEQTGYAWWIRRMEHCFRLYDVVRVDHFRGFDEYYSIPYGDRTAANGSWKKGPGMSLFRALKEHLGPVSIIAEDLGYVTDSVRQLVQGTGYPGMKLIEFAFDSREAGDYMPYTYEHNSIVYTGTHDNQPLAAWYLELTEEERRKACDYLNLPAKGLSSDEIVWAFIRLTLQTVADTAIIPMQDYLCLGREARMNQPSTLGTNWKWRLRADALSDELIQKMAHLAALYGRSCARK
jgi:4-alpha-glucanotransferase